MIGNHWSGRRHVRSGPLLGATCGPGFEKEIAFHLPLPLKKEPTGKDPLICGVEYVTSGGAKLEALFYAMVKGDMLKGFNRHSLNLISTEGLMLRVGVGRGIVRGG